MTGETSFGGMRAFVTGASRGIGRAIALDLAQAGCDVVGAARSGDALAELGAEIEGGGCRFLGVELDIGSPAAIPAAVARAREWQDGIDVDREVALEIVDRAHVIAGREFVAELPRENLDDRRILEELPTSSATL